MKEQTCVHVIRKFDEYVELWVKRYLRSIEAFDDRFQLRAEVRTMEELLKESEQKKKKKYRSTSSDGNK